MRIQYRGWMTPAAVGVISFAAGVGAGYHFKRYKVARDLENTVENLRAEVVDQSIVSEEVQVDLQGLQFMFEENVKHMNSVVQQADHVIAKFMTVLVEKLENIPEIKPVAAEPVAAQVVDITHVDTQRTTHPGGKSNKQVAKAVAKPKEQVVEVGTFPVAADEDWDYAEELKHRSKDKPYILHRDEFFSNESDYRQCSLTYYSGDNILCDENDVPVYNPEKIVGPLSFGHGSADPSIVYIRNDKLEAEYEVILEPGFYQTEVLGHEVEDGLAKDELKHFVQRFRASD